MKKLWTRLSALFLSIVMALSCLPFTVWAVDATYEYVLADEVVAGNGSLDPQASVARAEVAAVLDRFSKLFLA